MVGVFCAAVGTQLRCCGEPVVVWAAVDIVSLDAVELTLGLPLVLTQMLVL